MIGPMWTFWIGDVAAVKLSIASVSLSGGPPPRSSRPSRRPASRASRIFENDLLSFDGTPAEVRKRVADLGLEIITFQPFRGFEGMPPESRERTFARVERKFDLMAELGCDLLLVCSNVSPQSLGGIDRAAADLHALGEARQPPRHADLLRGVGVGAPHQRLPRLLGGGAPRRPSGDRARARHLPYLRSQDRPATDSGAIPRDRIFLVQVADAPLLDNWILLSWSRHFRPTSRARASCRCSTSWKPCSRPTSTGCLSARNLQRSVPRRLRPRPSAMDGLRSLLFLLDQLRGRTGVAPKRPAALPPRSKCLGTEFIEFAIDESEAPAFETLLRGLGFARAGVCTRSKDVTRWSQGAINIVVNTEKERSFAHSFNITHGTAVCAIGLKVEDAAATLARAERLLVKPFPPGGGMRASSKSRRCGRPRRQPRLLHLTPRASSAASGISNSSRPAR